MIIGNIVVLVIVSYALWIFISIGCIGGVKGYRQYKKDRDAALCKIKADKKQNTDCHVKRLTFG